jgi:hypothetical protein
MSGGVPRRVQISRTQRNTPSKAGNVVAKKALVLCNGRRSRKAMCNYVQQRAKTCAICPSGNIIPPGPGPPPTPHPHPHPDDATFSVTIQHYGITDSMHGSGLSGAAAGNLAVPTGGFLATDWNGYNSSFNTYATRYISFVDKLNTEVEVDRVMFNINGNPGPGNFGDHWLSGTGNPTVCPYSSLINPTAAAFAAGHLGDPLNGTHGATPAEKADDYPMVYKHFVRPFIKANYLRAQANKPRIRMGFTLYMGPYSGWNTFANSVDANDQLVLNEGAGILTSPGNYDPNASGTPHHQTSLNEKIQPDPLKLNNPNKNGAFNQCMAYIGWINKLILADTDSDLVAYRAFYPDDSLFWTVSSASFDNEENSSFYPTTEPTATTMWNQQVNGNPSTHPTFTLPPDYSATGGMNYTPLTTLIPSGTEGPDRIYQEVYDCDPTALKCNNDKSGPCPPTNSYPNCSKCCEYTFGNSAGEIGWGVKIVTGAGRQCPSNGGVNWKGTSTELTTCSKYFTEFFKNSNTAYYQPLPNNGTDPFGLIHKLNNSDYQLKGDPTNPNTAFNGYVLMFSVNSIAWGENIGKQGEDMFGTWSYPQFVLFLKEAAKYLTKAGGQGTDFPIVKPMLGIYEFDMIPSDWI